MTKKQKNNLFAYLEQECNFTALESNLNEIGNIAGTTFADYEQIIDMTARYPNKGKNFMYPLCSLPEEVGELMQVLNKSVRDKDGTLDAQDLTKMKKEMGDILWQLTALAHELGFTLEGIAAANYEKLVSRLERNTIGGSGDER